MSIKRRLHLKVVAAVLALSTPLIATHGNAKSFSFRHVEFMSADQREAAAQAFVANDLSPGTPLDSALKTLKRANAYCQTPSVASEPISCTHVSFERTPDNAGIIDVVWTVRVTPAADGTVSNATVTRSRSGF
ncbi:MAG TPA: hypothetical protein VGH03_22050 [Caulobacteraceae bacterium]|jgi:hypothetical protein